MCLLIGLAKNYFYAVKRARKKLTLHHTFLQKNFNSTIQLNNNHTVYLWILVKKVFCFVVTAFLVVDDWRRGRVP